jgi:hypothetical protein
MGSDSTVCAVIDPSCSMKLETASSISKSTLPSPRRTGRVAADFTRADDHGRQAVLFREIAERVQPAIEDEIARKGWQRVMTPVGERRDRREA